MKPTVLIGFILIVLGVLSFVYLGITVTRDKKVIDLGPLQVRTEQKEFIPIPPLVGGIALVACVFLVATGTRKS